MANKKRVVAAVGWGFLSLFIIFPVGLWGALALWFRAPGPVWARAFAATVFALLALATIAAFRFNRRLLALGGFALAFAALLGWWGTIKPPADANWAPEVARQTTGVVKGDILTLENMRDFDWISQTAFTEHWVTQTFDLSKLRTLDVFLGYWAGPEMTHPILSFGFEDGRFLAWSIEVRKVKGGEFSPIADLFRNSALVILAATERDVVRVRANMRGEDVQLYRLSTPPDAARALLLQYVEDSNALAVAPQFYNSLTTNCTTTIVRLIRASGGKMAFDWRLIVNGFLPEFLYDRGAVDRRISLAELRRRAQVSEIAIKADGSPDFSRLIRKGVPSPFDEAR